MASITLPRQVSHLHSVDENLDDFHGEEIKKMTGLSRSADHYRYSLPWSKPNEDRKAARAASFNEESTTSSSNNKNNTDNNRFKHFCTRLKRRFSITKEYRTRSEDINRSLSTRFSNYKSFSSKIDKSSTEFQWPDFEQIYDSIPICLANALPGLDDISVDDDEEEEEDDRDHDQHDCDHDGSVNTLDFTTEDSNQQLDLFKHCRRGHYFRRNAICGKLDKSQYHRQLDTFVQQLMVEKLMRTWT